MSKLNTTALLLFFIAVYTISCKKTPAEEVYTTNAALSTSRVRPMPATTSAATGTFAGNYNTRTKTLSYTISWSGLQFPADSIRAIHIHGLADTGRVAVSVPVGTFLSSGSHQGVAQNITGYQQVATGSISGTLYADGVLIREEDLLAGQYYVDIHTKSFPNGQLRGQITFDQ